MALIDYTNQNEEQQAEVVNNVTTSIKDTTTETILDMISKLTKKVEELQKPADTDINPRTGKSSKNTAGHVDAAHTGARTAHKRNQVIKMLRTLKTVPWVQ